MIRLAFRVIIACLILTALVGCGAFQFTLPEGSSFAQAPGPPLPPNSSDISGGFPISAAAPGFPTFFPGIFPGGFGGGGTTTGADTNNPTTGSNTNPNTTGTGQTTSQ